MTTLKDLRSLLFVIMVGGLAAVLLSVRGVVAASGDGADNSGWAANAGWTEIGSGSATGGGISHSTSAFVPSLAIGPDGKPVVAWYNSSSGIFDIYVKHWNGSSWAEMGSGSASDGGISHNADSSLDPSLAIGSDGKPVVAWQDRSNGSSFEIYVRRWNGSAWLEVAGSATGGGISHNAGDSVEPSLAIDRDGRPVVAWQDNSGGNNDIYVRRWNGSAWIELAGSAGDGGISKNAGNSINPSLAIASDGNPIVAWEEYSGGNPEIYLRHWNGSSWAELGGSATGGGISNTGHLGNWSRKPSLAIDHGGAPVVAWEHMGSTGFEIYARRWNGSTWAELGGSATGGGISDNARDSVEPSLAIGSDGAPVVAWHDQSDGNNYQVYARRWNNSDWVEVSIGSATGPGISHSVVDAMHPSLAISPNGDPVVAWNDGTNLTNKWDIYIRRFSPTSMPFKAFTPVTLRP